MPSHLQQLSPGKPRSLHAGSDAPHILLVVDGFPKILGGGERIVLRLAELLPDYGFRVSILTLRVDPAGEFDPAHAPCPLYLLPLTSTYNLEALRGAMDLRRFLRRERIALVHTFFESSDIWAGSVTRLLSRARLVWSRRDMGILRGRKHDLAYRAMRRFPHAVVAVSRQVAEHVIGVDGVTASKVHVIHNGLDLPPLSPNRVPARSANAPITITTVGNIRRVKGHDLLVQAASAVVKRHPAVQFTVAGDVLEPEFYAALQQQISELGLSGNFSFVGRITDLRQHLETADLFVLPSRSEGFSNALIEAMSLAMPVIAADVGGNGEAVQDGVTGLLIPSEDVDALRDAILALIEHPVRAAQLGQAARHAVQDNFTSDAMMHAVAGLFTALLT